MIILTRLVPNGWTSRQRWQKTEELSERSVRTGRRMFNSGELLKDLLGCSRPTRLSPPKGK